MGGSGVVGWEQRRGGLWRLRSRGTWTALGMTLLSLAHGGVNVRVMVGLLLVGTEGVTVSVTAGPVGG